MTETGPKTETGPQLSRQASVARGDCVISTKISNFFLFVFSGRIVIVTGWTRNVQKNTSVLQTFRGEKTSVHMSSFKIYPIGNYPIF